MLQNGDNSLTPSFGALLGRVGISTFPFDSLQRRRQPARGLPKDAPSTHRCLFKKQRSKTTTSEHVPGGREIPPRYSAMLYLCANPPSSGHGLLQGFSGEQYPEESCGRHCASTCPLPSLLLLTEIVRRKLAAAAPGVAVAGLNLYPHLLKALMLDSAMGWESAKEGWRHIQAMFSEIQAPNEVRNRLCPSSERSSVPLTLGPRWPRPWSKSPNMSWVLTYAQPPR